MNRTSMLLTTAAVAMFALSVSAQEKPLTRKDVEEIVKQTILDNPEVLMKSVESYQTKMRAEQMGKMQQSIIAMKDVILKDTNSPVAGNPKGDVVVVEFFDYHCGYCKHMLPVVTQLIEQDSNVKVIFRELPILSEDSTTAAKAALAVYQVAPKKYFEYHSALMKANGTFDEQKLLDIAKSIQVDPDKVKAAMNSPEVAKELSDTSDLAKAIGISGTPAMIIGNQLIPGAVDLTELKRRIKAERENKKN